MQKKHSTFYSNYKECLKELTLNYVKDVILNARTVLPLLL